MHIYEEDGWEAEVDIVEDKSNEEEERYVLRVIRTLADTGICEPLEDGGEFEVFILRGYEAYSCWSLKE